jgi:hypothetical protein
MMKGRAGVDGREGEHEKKKKKKKKDKEKKKQTSIHLAFMSGRAQEAQVKNGETPPLHVSAHAVDLLQQNRESVQKMHYNKAGMTPETAIVANMYLFSKM